LAELRAVIFDVDGTLVDSERDVHRPAFNAAFAQHDLPYRWDVAEYGRLLDVTGGRRRIESYLAQRQHPGDLAALAAQVHATKTRIVRDRFEQGAVRPRPGVCDLITELAAAGLRIAVCTTGTRDWVYPLLERVFGVDRFDAIVTGSDVIDLKPDPDGYLRTLDRLNLAAAHAVAVEDSRNGFCSAVRAGLRCWVVTNPYTAGQLFDGALGIFDSFERSINGLIADRILTRRQ
jgi:HAD superfamily hydrolase (TIGR01509 family)